MEEEENLKKIIKLAINYFQNFILPNLKKREPNQDERTAIINLIKDISSKKSELNSEEYQSLVYKYGKQVYPDNLRDWFIALYEILLDQKVAPDLVLYLICIKRRKS